MLTPGESPRGPGSDWFSGVVLAEGGRGAPREDWWANSPAFSPSFSPSLFSEQELGSFEVVHASQWRAGKCA